MGKANYISKSFVSKGFSSKSNFQSKSFGTAVPPPSPATPQFVDLSWEGSNLSKYTFGIPAATPNTYNYIKRTSAATSFDTIIESVQNWNNTGFFVFGGDVKTGSNTGCWYGIGENGVIGTSFSDMDFALRSDRSGSNINWEWWESGVKQSDLLTTTNGDNTSWRIEFDNQTINVYVNGQLEYTTSSSYTTEDVSLKTLGRDSNSPVIDHIYARTAATSNSSLIWLGNSITYGRSADVSGEGGHYTYLTEGYTDHDVFTNVVLADSGDISQNVIDNQVPQISTFYDAAYDKNIACLMIGINDLRNSVPLATIQANISSIVSSLQSAGYFVVIYTVIRDHSQADFIGRGTLNTWILSGSSGADDIIDLTGTVLDASTGWETYFEADKLHPSPLGMEVIALNSWSIIKSVA